jgi:hypothetical protein
MSDMRKPNRTALTPVHFVLYVVFGMLALVLGYAAFSTSTDIRSRASNDCMGTLKPSREKVCTTATNKNGKKVTKCSMVTKYNCVMNKRSASPAPKKTPTPRQKYIQQAK